MKKSWYRRKNGRGLWRPSTWQGWISVSLVLVLAVVDFIRLDTRSHSVSDTIRPWILQMAILGGVLLLVAWLTGDGPGTGPKPTGRP